MSSSLSSPDIAVSGSVVTLRWASEGLVAIFDRWGKTGDGSPKAELTVTTSAPGYASHLLGPVSVNLVGPRSRSDLAKQLSAVAADLLDWTIWAEQACVLAVRAYRQGEPIIALAPATGKTHTWRVQPLLYEGLPTVIFGLGGSGKSGLALWLALQVERGQPINGLLPLQGHVLYLDYESDQEEAELRLAHFQAGDPTLTGHTPLYRRMTQPLAAEAQTLQPLIAERAISMLIVDSLALACGGRDLADPSTAVAYFLALRQLGCASLSLAHVPKNSENPTIYGSVFFTNIARMTWEIKSTYEEPTLHLGLFNRKSNQARQAPIGLDFTYSPQDGAISVSSTSITDNEEFVAHAPLAAQIQHYLQEEPKTASQLAQILGKPLDSVVKALHRGSFDSHGEGKGALWFTAKASEAGRP